MQKLPFGAAFGIGLLVAGQAWADPCEARVTGYTVGATVSGTVRYIGDGDSICIGTTRDPRSWIEIRLADFYAPELSAPGGRQAKVALERTAMGKHAVCTVRRGNNGKTFSYDRLIAVCRIGGVSLGDAMRRAGSGEGGNGR